MPKGRWRGDVGARLGLGWLLRQTAKTAAYRASSARWLKQAAKAGSVPKMAEYGPVPAYGPGALQDVVGAP